MNGPAGLDDTDPPDPNAPPTIPDLDDSDSRVLLSVGTDNPFFNLRDRSAPGGVGYYRLHSQLQLFDTGRTGCSLTLNAVTPAGLEANGVADGPTYLSPALTLFHDLGDGTGLHCYVGQDVRANAAWRQTVGHSMQYSVAMQQAIPGLNPDPNRGLFLFVETVGSVGVRDDNTAPTLEVVPGVHYRLSDNWWVSGGLALPVGTSQDARRFQFTCSWRY